MNALRNSRRPSASLGRAPWGSNGGRALLAGLLMMAAGVCSPQTPASTATETLALSPGTVRTLEFADDLGTVVIANPATADVQVLDQRRLIVLGQAPGTTSLQVHGVDGEILGAYTVRVRNQEFEPARQVVSRIAGDDTGIEVESVGGVLFVTGTAKSPGQAEQVLRGIRTVAGETPVVDAVGLDEPAQVNLEVLISEVSRNVTQALGIDWSLDVNPFEHPLRTWVTGTGVRLGTGALQVGEVNEQTLQWLPLPTDGVANLPDLLNPRDGGGGEAGLVAPQFEVLTRELGVVGSGNRGGDGGIVLAHSKEVNSGKYRATLFLEALAENGLAVVHARPNLTAVSGESAEFFSGLEIPVPTITDRGTIGTEYRETGVSLRFTPTVLDSNQISLTVQPRIRELAAGGAIIAGTVVPNVNERSASTTVELGDGESIAIAGLYRRSTTHSGAGIPLLKDIPLWGALFRSTSERDESVELIIVVTPRIVSAVPSQTQVASAVAGPGDTSRQLDNEFYY